MAMGSGRPNIYISEVIPLTQLVSKAKTSEVGLVQRTSGYEQDTLRLYGDISLCGVCYKDRLQLEIRGGWRMWWRADQTRQTIWGQILVRIRWDSFFGPRRFYQGLSSVELRWRRRCFTPMTHSGVLAGWALKARRQALSCNG